MIQISKQILTQFLKTAIIYIVIVLAMNLSSYFMGSISKTGLNLLKYLKISIYNFIIWFPNSVIKGVNDIFKSYVQLQDGMLFKEDQFEDSDSIKFQSSVGVSFRHQFYICSYIFFVESTTELISKIIKSRNLKKLKIKDIL